MKKTFIVLCLVGGLFLQSACAPLSMTEQAKYSELQKEGAVTEPIQHKNVWAAGILDFLVPGFGHFYLGQWGSGGGLFLSNILWPLSPFWATPAAVADTDNANKRYTVEYYTLGPGKEEVAKLKQKKCFAKAKEYIVLGMQNGKKTFSQREISQVLFLDDFSPEEVTSIDWNQLQMVTGCKITKMAETGTKLTPTPSPGKG